MIQILSYLNTNEDLNVDDAHEHTKAAQRPGAKLTWLDGEIYDDECNLLDVPEDNRLNHDGDISIIYTSNDNASPKQIAQALINHVS